MKERLSTTLNSLTLVLAMWLAKRGFKVRGSALSGAAINRE